MRWIGLVAVLFCSLSGWSEAETPAKKPNPFLPNGWRVHDLERPVPPVVEPGHGLGEAPSDAIVLFDGHSMDAWVGTLFRPSPIHVGRNMSIVCHRLMIFAA